MALSTLQQRIPIYESKDYAKLSSISSNFILEASKVLGAKYFQFLPFYLESRATTINKTFVLKMDLLPEGKRVKLGMQMGSSEVDLRELMPKTVKELGNAHVWGR